MTWLPVRTKRNGKNAWTRQTIPANSIGATRPSSMNTIRLPKPTALMPMANIHTRERSKRFPSATHTGIDTMAGST